MRVVVCGSRAFGADVVRLVLDAGHDLAAVWAPPTGGGSNGRDRCRAAAEERGVAWRPAGTLRAGALPAGTDLIVAAHSHDFVGRRTRNAARLGAVGYHPSLLPRHRGRDAVRWTVRMGDPVAGGSVYWLTDAVDGGPIAAQDWCWVRPGDTAETLWRRDLAPMGLRLLEATLGDAAAGRLYRLPQDEAVATWEPALDAAPLHRPELEELPPAGGWAGPAYIVARRPAPQRKVRESSARA